MVVCPYPLIFWGSWVSLRVHIIHEFLFLLFCTTFTIFFMAEFRKIQKLCYVGVPWVVQSVKDLALSPLWFGSLLRHGFDPWPRNFHMPQVQPKKTKKKKKKKKKMPFFSLCSIHYSEGNMKVYIRTCHYVL